MLRNTVQQTKQSVNASIAAAAKALVDNPSSATYTPRAELENIAINNWQSVVDVFNKYNTTTQRGGNSNNSNKNSKTTNLLRKHLSDLLNVETGIEELYETRTLDNVGVKDAFDTFNTLIETAIRDNLFKEDDFLKFSDGENADKNANKLISNYVEYYVYFIRRKFNDDVINQVRYDSIDKMYKNNKLDNYISKEILTPYFNDRQEKTKTFNLTSHFLNKKYIINEEHELAFSDHVKVLLRFSWEGDTPEKSANPIVDVKLRVMLSADQKGRYIYVGYEMNHLFTYTTNLLGNLVAVINGDQLVEQKKNEKTRLFSDIKTIVDEANDATAVIKETGKGLTCRNLLSTDGMYHTLGDVIADVLIRVVFSSQKKENSIVGIMYHDCAQNAFRAWVASATGTPLLNTYFPFPRQKTKTTSDPFIIFEQKYNGEWNKKKYTGPTSSKESYVEMLNNFLHEERNDESSSRTLDTFATEVILEYRKKTQSYWTSGFGKETYNDEQTAKTRLRAYETISDNIKKFAFDERTPFIYIPVAYNYVNESDANGKSGGGHANMLRVDLPTTKSSTFSFTILEPHGVLSGRHAVLGAAVQWLSEFMADTYKDQELVRLQYDEGSTSCPRLQSAVPMCYLYSVYGSILEFHNLPHIRTALAEYENTKNNTKNNTPNNTTRKFDAKSVEHLYIEALCNPSKKEKLKLMAGNDKTKKMRMLKYILSGDKMPKPSELTFTSTPDSPDFMKYIMYRGTCLADMLLLMIVFHVNKVLRDVVIENYNATLKGGRGGGAKRKKAPAKKTRRNVTTGRKTASNTR